MGRSRVARRRAVEQSTRLGGEVVSARAVLAMTVRQMAARAGVAPSTAARVELGDPNVTLSTVCAVAGAVGLDLVVRAYPGRTPSLRDTGQLVLAELLREQAHRTWQPTIELSVGGHGQAIDVALFGPQEIWAAEIERMAADFQAQYRRADGKREALASLHQRPVRLVMAVEDTRRNRTALQQHLPLVRSVLPAGSRDILAALRTGRPLGRDGLLWLRRRSQKQDR